MVNIAGDQSIPSALLDAYRATLGEKNPKSIVRKRYPYRMPRMKTGRGNVTAAQQIQRDRFIYVKDKFKTLSHAEKTRWYAAMPEWSSLLWYYNFFMLSGLMDVLGADARGAAVIKSIQNRTVEIPLAGTTITHVNVIDASKAVVMLWGASHNYEMAGSAPGEYAWAWAVYPIWGTLSNTNISLTWAVAPQAAAKVALQVIEYI